MSKKSSTKKKAKGKAAPAKAAAPAPPSEGVDESLRRLHSIEALGKQVQELDKKIIKNAAVEADAQAELKKARQAAKALHNDREDLLAEQTAIATGKFSERLAFPPPPPMEEADTAAMFERLLAVDKHFNSLPLEGTEEFKKLTPTEQRLVPKKAQELSEERHQLYRRFHRATRGALEEVLVIPGKDKKRPALAIEVLTLSNHFALDHWYGDGELIDAYDVPSIATEDMEEFLESWNPMVDKKLLQEHPWVEPATSVSREHAIARAIKHVRQYLRITYPKPQEEVLADLQIVESRLRQLEATQPVDCQGEPLRILPEDQDTPGFEEQPVDAGGKKKKGARRKPVEFVNRAAGQRSFDEESGRQSTVGPLAAAGAAQRTYDAMGVT